MADDINYGVLESIMLPQTQALQALAMRPQKSLQQTNTISNTVPYALQDMLNARNTISNSTNELEQALKLRESPWYATLKALGEVRGSSEPGKWLESGLRGLSTGYTTLDDIKAENAKLLRDARLEDLAQRLAYDKAMGEKQTQFQRQNIDYIEMPWGGAGGKQQGAVGGPNQIVENMAWATGDGIDPEEYIKKYNTGGFIETTASNVDAQDNATLGAKVARLVSPQNTGARSALAQNLTDKVIGPKIQTMIQTMGGQKGADTIREVTMRIGPLATLTNLGTEEQIGAIVAAKRDILDILNKDRLKGGLEPLTMEEFQPAWNKLFSGIAEWEKTYGQNNSQTTNKTEPKQETSSSDLDAYYKSIGGK